MFVVVKGIMKLKDIIFVKEGMMVVNDDGQLIDQEHVLPEHTMEDVEKIAKAVFNPENYVRYARMKMDVKGDKKNGRKFHVTLTMNHSNWHAWVDMEFIKGKRQIVLTYKYTDEEIGGNLEKIHTDIFRDSTMECDDDIEFLIGRILEIIRYGVSIAERDKMWAAGWGKDMLKITIW